MFLPEVIHVLVFTCYWSEYAIGPYLSTMRQHNPTICLERNKNQMAVGPMVMSAELICVRQSGTVIAFYNK